MRSSGYLVLTISATLMLQLQVGAQQAGAPSSNVVPRLVNFSGRAMNVDSKPISGVAGVTFAIYKEQNEGSPLWFETQNVNTDAKGNYTVQLGATMPTGLPLDVFTSGEARWLGVQINGGEEQARILLLSVPYALKAADAQTLGGLPASAFVLAAPGGVSTEDTSASTTASPTTSSSTAHALVGSTPVTTAGGTTGTIPLWDSSSDIANSIVTQTGSGSSARIGINIANPLFTLDVKGSELVRGLFELATVQFANTTRGFNSNPLNLESSAWNSGTGTYTLNHFQWQAEPLGNNTTSPGATLNLLYGTDPKPLTETGLKLASNGQFTFAPGQKFPGAGSVTSVGLSAPTSDFTVSGSPVTTSGTLGLAWKVAPTNANTANAIVKRDSLGNFSSGAISATTVTAFNSTGSIAIDGQSAGIGVYGTSSTSQAVWGESTGTGFSNGSGPDGVHGVTHSNAGSGVGGLNTADGGVGIWGEAPAGFGFYTPNNVQQARTAGGWVKAMVLGSGGNGQFQAGIVSCFNSTLAGPAATTPPCGFTFDKAGTGDYILNFGFQVSDRFFSVTTQIAGPSTGVCTSFTGYCPHSLSVDDLEVTLWATSVQQYADGNFYLVVY